MDQPNSELEHSSIPATIKKIFTLSSNFLTHRDAWAGTFEQVVGELITPRTDCPEKLPEVAPLRTTEAKEDAGVSKFQSEVVQLAAGNHFLSSFAEEAQTKMSVKEDHEYVKGAVSRFIRASKEAKNWELMNQPLLIWDHRLRLDLYVNDTSISLTGF